MLISGNKKNQLSNLTFYNRDLKIYIMKYNVEKSRIEDSSGYINN